MNKPFLISFVLAALVVLLPGCATKYYPDNEGKFVPMDKGANTSVTSSGLQETILPDGRLRVIAKIQNLENRRIQVQVSCVFKDAQGFSTGDETPWTNLILTENSVESVKFESMNNLAKTYSIRVREAR